MNIIPVINAVYRHRPIIEKFSSSQFNFSTCLSFKYKITITANKIIVRTLLQRDRVSVSFFENIIFYCIKNIY